MHNGKTTKKLGGIDILVNNAARPIVHDAILEYTSEQFDETFKTNVYAMFWISRAALLSLEQGAAIINATSVNAYDPGEYIMEQFGARTPMQRPDWPAEMAGVYMLVASYATGQVYGAVGGNGRP